jgi:WhiB family transcriptional regulator, redox-sensing transcriptional regulator
MTRRADPGRWWEWASCRGMNPALFYDSHPDTVAAAKQTCNDCPVQSACADAAIAEAERYGVWGGLAEDERPTPDPRRDYTKLRPRRR